MGMRVVSQDGSGDFPYDSTIIRYDWDGMVYAVPVGVDRYQMYVVARYSGAVHAVMAVRQMRAALTHGEKIFTFPSEERLNLFKELTGET